MPMATRRHVLDHVDPTDPAILTTEQRLAEVSAILAAGVLRLRRRCALPATSPPVGNLQNPQESGEPGLEYQAETRLHVQRG
jgi:hypothetical protein